MNREELEKLFDETFESNYYYGLKSIMKEFIFNTIIQEVLSSMLVYEGTGTDPIIEKRKYTNRLIKQKAKSIYNITI